ncbi:MAG: hypothetical protein R3C14_30610 [Caldilineaceae bacterium]
MTKQKNKKNFAGFNLKEAMQHLGIEKLHPWPLDPTPRPLSPFFLERLQRLRIFDTARTERAKELLVDAYCEESLINYPDLKLWKAAPLSADDVTGVVDYLLTPQRDYIDTPMLCVVEAKKDDFEQGLAQSLVEMYACQQLNALQDIHHPLYAIVTNGDGWRFYRYEADQVYESDLYTRTGHETLLSILDAIFALCQQNKSVSAQRIQ